MPGCTNPGHKSPQFSYLRSSLPSCTTSWSSHTTGKPPTPSTPRICSTTTRISARAALVPHAKEHTPKWDILVLGSNKPMRPRPRARSNPPRVCEPLHGDRRHRIPDDPSGAWVSAPPTTSTREAPREARNAHSRRAACSAATAPRR